MEPSVASTLAPAPWHWLLLGFALLLAERVSRKGFLLALAAGAWLTGLVGLFSPLALHAQLIVFFVVTAIAAFAARLLLKSH